MIVRRVDSLVRTMLYNLVVVGLDFRFILNFSYISVTLLVKLKRVSYKFYFGKPERGKWC